MSKILIGVFLGVFVGALAYEIINRKHPELIKKFEAKAAETIDDLLEPTVLPTV